MDERPLVGGALHLSRTTPRSPGWAPPASGSAHCPSSNMMIGGGGVAPVAELRAAGVPVGLGVRRLGVDRLRLAVDGGPQRAAAGPAAARSGSDGRSRRAGDRHPRAGPRCLGREGELGELSVGAAGDLVCWPLEGVRFAGALSDPDRGLAAVRPGRRPPHRRGRADAWWRTARSTAAGCRRHARPSPGRPPSGSRPPSDPESHPARPLQTVRPTRVGARRKSTGSPLSRGGGQVVVRNW